MAGGAVLGVGASATLAAYLGLPTAGAAPGVGLQPAAPAAAGQQVVRVSGHTGPHPEQVSPLLTHMLGIAVFVKPNKDGDFAGVAPHR